jgi:hypothetical protein
MIEPLRGFPHLFMGKEMTEAMEDPLAGCLGDHADLAVIDFDLTDATTAAAVVANRYLQEIVSHYRVCSGAASYVDTTICGMVIACYLRNLNLDIRLETHETDRENCPTPETFVIIATAIDLEAETEIINAGAMYENMQGSSQWCFMLGCGFADEISSMAERGHWELSTKFGHPWKGEACASTQNVVIPDLDGVELDTEDGRRVFETVVEAIGDFMLAVSDACNVEVCDLTALLPDDPMGPQD